MWRQGHSLLCGSWITLFILVAVMNSFKKSSDFRTIIVPTTYQEEFIGGIENTSSCFGIDAKKDGIP
ncbi:hypothetical protein Pelo_17864 [Pelomyxa schiedti]|nr:hypothetical protein Pelo_17856 [Pelomyxa schiedti]KAH3731306.1 hypothetical protein Pelo_17857 [Pelomyxa schiedti]KAH3731307.1 hypothetical protein Pelo_17858 [Pelomyxa schiedti]KAH3731308.1 hypothetical protein Pelo_17859 [Pelomyxa schiedti]KAH3731309.1 hypothetical protein Pelo_17860 [Pelomyxa schiedti]